MPADPTGIAPSPAPDPRMAQALGRDRRRVVLSYLALALAWMLASDSAVQLLVGDPHQALMWHNAKGMVFALASAALLYLLLRPLADHVLRTHARLQASESRLRQMFEGNPGPILVYDLHALSILDANPAACATFGWNRDELLARTIDILWPPGQDASLQAKLDVLREAPEQLCVLRAQLQLKDGTLRQMELRSNAIDYDGRQARLLIAIDRTSEDLAQLRRDQALARVEEAHELARIGAWELDPATGLGRFSSQVYRLLGRRPPEARRWHRFDELLVAADPGTAVQTEHLLDELYGGGHVQVDVLLPLLAMDGRALMVHLRAESGVDEAGRPRILGTLQDVTEREQSRRLLREREEQFRELVRVLPDGVVILSEEHVLYANAWAAGLFGYGSHTLLGEPLAELVAAEDLPRVRAQLRAGQPQHGPGHSSVVAMRRLDGRRFQAGLAVGEVRYGGRDCKLLIVRDLSESERTRSALETSNRELQAMAGRLFSLQEDERRAISRDLHDDIGQAITAMKLSAYAALDDDDAVRRREDIGQIIALADTTVAKLRDISTLLRPPQLDALGLEAALSWQARVLFRSSPIELLADIDDLPTRPDSSIEQACFRIAQESLTNALRHARASQVQLQLRDVDARGLHLQIRDDGEGFDPEGPRGLGLIVMRERAQSVGGQVRIESAHGAGTLVDVHLPYQATPVAAPDTTEH
ncbi:PAS domain-containing sensor histidine kinase [Stenotrophomonas sp. 24(2023)]|uniref:sensor histidine kinase n=1 Tax=Stenotrophomonas sp. 24(2023) TaxID=3068324 RepID=UPI0027DFEBBA|nr:PAS domain-containing sensor histidine kinase [Stenotrophomonas sp. 24(2023)]WMJ69142.1 PAS domain-containing sensor histidine kinase [Stenotrophomonas sp. 24(2023)]